MDGKLYSDATAAVPEDEPTWLGPWSGSGDTPSGFYPATISNMNARTANSGVAKPSPTSSSRMDRKSGVIHCQGTRFRTWFSNAPYVSKVRQRLPLVAPMLHPHSTRC